MNAMLRVSALDSDKRVPTVLGSRASHMTNDTTSLITSRSEFHAALRAAFGEAAAAGTREIWLCDEDFADWPLGERAVIDDLTRWATSSRRLTLIARDFDELVRRHPRFVTWRRHWAHIVSCCANTEIATGEMPTLLVAAGTVNVRLSDAIHHRGRWSHEAADELRCQEQNDAILQRSAESFPATTAGL